MSEEFNEGENDGNTQGGGGLRKQLEQALEALKSQKEALAKFEARDRTDSVRALLKAKGAPEGAASFYTAEDVSEGAVDKWLKEHENVFVLSGQSAPQEQAQAPDPNAQAAQRVADASFGNARTDSSGLSATFADPEALLNLIQNGTDEELVQAGVLQPQSKRLMGGYVRPRG